MTSEGIIDFARERSYPTALQNSTLLPLLLLSLVTQRHTPKTKSKFENEYDYIVGYHGVGGPLTVNRYPSQSEFIAPAIKALERLGHRLVDTNGPTQVGISAFQGTLRRGQRCSVAKGYLVPAENRTNLDIVPEAYVTKIVIKNKIAVGVQFDFQGRRRIVTARKEVILSAGAVNSAQLLILSGIGPRKTLEKFEIPVVADLPVGRNFQDQCGGFRFFSVDNSIPPLDKKFQDPKNVLQYINNRTGILASPTGIFSVSFLKDNNRCVKNDVPDYQLYIREVPSALTPEVFGLSKSNFDKIFGPYINGTNVICVSQLLNARSRGYVSIRSTDPYAQPVIDPNYLEDPQDELDIVAGLEMCGKVLLARDFAGLKVKEFTTVIPGCESFVHNEHQRLKCNVKALGHSLSHQVGTARMGNIEDDSTVVDPKLRVKGIKQLRVVDASVMPIVPKGNSNAPVIMVAERAAYLIKKKIEC